MNVALCYERIFPNKGGCETYIADLTRRLVADQHTVHLYCVDYDKELIPASIIHHPMEEIKGPRFMRPWKFATACEKLLKAEPQDVSIGFIKTWGQDILMPQGGLHIASYRHNIRKHAPGLGRFTARLLKQFDVSHWSYGLLERKQLRDHRSRFVVASQFVQSHLARHYHIQGERVTVVPNAIDPERFRGADRLLLRAAVREECQIAPGDSVGLFVGHNPKLKGLEPLLKAVALLPGEAKFRLLVCGASKDKRFQQQADRLGIRDRVKFLGFREDVRDVFFAADFLIHPTFYDPCALVTFEALACGLPVITSRFNGAAEKLPDSMQPLLVGNPHDTASLANAIHQLCSHETRLKLSRHARQAATEWTFEHHYQELLKVMFKVHEAKSPKISIG